MRRTLVRWLASAAIGVSLLGPTAALARPKIAWARIQVPDGDGAARTSKVLKAALEQAAKKANFGKTAKSVTLSARVVELTTEQRGDVLRVSCTALGRVVGGPSARSKISFGGSPAAREDLEKQVLTMVANGLVARLAQIARTQEAK
jgi:hypothetical protein